MAFTQIRPTAQNEYGVAPQDVPGLADFRAGSARGDSFDMSIFSMPDRGIVGRLARRLHLTSRRRVIAFVGLLLLGGFLLLSVLSVLGQDTSTQVMSMSPAAEKYWRNLDVGQVQRDMKNWSREDLGKLFLTVRGQTADPETRKNIDFLGRMLRLPGFESSSSSSSSSSLLSALFSQPIFLLGIFVTMGIWGAAVVISLAPYLQRAPALSPTGAAMPVPSEQLADAVLEELLPDVELEAVTPAAPDPKEEEKKAEEVPNEETEESSAGLGDLASLFEEEDTSISALEAFCKNLADVVVDDLVTKAKELARNLRASIAQNARRPQ